MIGGVELGGIVEVLLLVGLQRLVLVLLLGVVALWRLEQVRLVVAVQRL